MADNDTLDPHLLDSPRARAYFAEFLEDPSLEFVEDTFEFDADDLGEASDALLAAELVAAWIGFPADGLPEDVKAKCGGKTGPNKKLMNKTRAAVRAALDADAPLFQHWATAGLDPWLANVKKLLDRLT